MDPGSTDFFLKRRQKAFAGFLLNEKNKKIRRVTTLTNLQP
jgi:hypothetical protein